MTVKLEAILSIEDSLADRLQKSWRKLSKGYKAEVTKALEANDPVAAQEVADSVDMTPVYTENEAYIRMQTYASLMHGATRLTPHPKDTTLTTGAYEPMVQKVMAQFKKQIAGSATEQVKKELVNLIALEFYEELELVQKYNKNHDPKTGRFTSGVKIGGNAAMLDELWEHSQGHPFDRRIRLVNVSPDHADDLVGIEVREWDDMVHLSSIITFSPKGKGAGSRALQSLTRLADKHGVTLDGLVKPIDNAGDSETSSLTKDQLHKWYAKHGFERERGDIIRRKPKVVKFEANQPRHPAGSDHGGQWRDAATWRSQSGMHRDKDKVWRRGTVAVDPEVSDRLTALRVPPAWTEVKLHPSSAHGLQAVGRDSKGRSQYIYSAAHKASQAAKKFEKLKDFHTALPILRQKLDSELSRGNLSKSDLAANMVLRLIDKTAFRIGSTANTGGDKKAYGASTLLPGHVKVDGDKLSFSFVGKKGVRNSKTFTDKVLAQYVTKRKAEAKRGEDLFVVSASKVNSYMDSHIDPRFNVKDFRTYHGTYKAFAMVKTMRAPKSTKTYKKARKRVGVAIAKFLGNTPKVALDAYISPEVFAAWQVNV
jgi:DNA topoisomerase-1